MFHDYLGVLNNKVCLSTPLKVTETEKLVTFGFLYFRFGAFFSNTEFAFNDSKWIYKAETQFEMIRYTGEDDNTFE